MFQYKYLTSKYLRSPDVQTSVVLKLRSQRRQMPVTSRPYARGECSRTLKFILDDTPTAGMRLCPRLRLSVFINPVVERAPSYAARSHHEDEELMSDVARGSNIRPIQVVAEGSRRRLGMRSPDMNPSKDQQIAFGVHEDPHEYLATSRCNFCKHLTNMVSIRPHHDVRMKTPLTYTSGFRSYP